jgi:hypothetical protein
MSPLSLRSFPLPQPGAATSISLPRPLFDPSLSLLPSLLLADDDNHGCPSHWHACDVVARGTIERLIRGVLRWGWADPASWSLFYSGEVGGSDCEDRRFDGEVGSSGGVTPTHIQCRRPWARADPTTGQHWASLLPRCMATTCICGVAVQDVVRRWLGFQE